jgi:hypothetical protein
MQALVHRYARNAGRLFCLDMISGYAISAGCLCWLCCQALLATLASQTGYVLWLFWL